jgi:hypothetical protein
MVTEVENHKQKPKLRRVAPEKRKDNNMKTQQPLKLGAVRTASVALAGLIALLGVVDPSSTSGGDKQKPAYELKTLDVPTDVPISPGIGASAFGINEDGQIVGNFPKYASDGVTIQIHGFLFEKGAFLDVAIPGSPWTELLRINDHGVAVGDYQDVYGDYSNAHDFVRRPDGTIHLLAPVMPGAAFQSQSVGINNDGTIVGSFVLADGIPQGFILKHDVYTVFNYPGATATFLTDINDSGTIAGFRQDAQGNYHGFLRHEHGSLAPVEVPGAGPIGSAAVGLNNQGDVVGTYFDAASNQHGFVLSGGLYNTLDFPNDGGFTSANSINEKGVIVGTYGPGGEQAFIAIPVRHRE